jgi:hypothetical protein
MNKEQILEELERIDRQIKELKELHNYYCDLLPEFDEDKSVVDSKE